MSQNLFMILKWAAQLVHGDMSIYFFFLAVKPKQPTIISVIPTKNGNYRITWETNYNESRQAVLASRLIPELSYSTQDGNEVSPFLGGKIAGFMTFTYQLMSL